jgi:hypothetical protein
LPAKQRGQQEFTFEGITTRVKTKQRPHKVSAALATATALNSNGGEQGATQASAAHSNGAASPHVQQELDLGF